MPLSAAFDSLSHALRRLTEAIIGFQQLAHIDFDEAVGNVEEAIDGVLNKTYGFNEESKNYGINLYAVPETSIILQLRNDRQHGGRNKFITIYSYAKKNISELNKRGIACVNFIKDHEPYHPCLDVHLEGFISIIKSTPQRHEKTMKDILGYTHAESWHAEAEKIYFFNFLPLITNAIITITNLSARLITPQSVESETFLDFFSKQEPYELSNFKITNQNTSSATTY